MLQLSFGTLNLQVVGLPEEHDSTLGLFALALIAGFTLLMVRAFGAGAAREIGFIIYHRVGDISAVKKIGRTRRFARLLNCAFGLASAGERGDTQIRFSECFLRFLRWLLRCPCRRLHSTLRKSRALVA